MPAKGKEPCPQCGSTNTLARIDKSFFCRSCGYDTRPTGAYGARPKDKEEKKL